VHLLVSAPACLCVERQCGPIGLRRPIGLLRPINRTAALLPQDMVDKDNFKRVCLYLTSCATYVAEPEDSEILKARQPLSP
jgi:hypothetical protein